MALHPRRRSDVVPARRPTVRYGFPPPVRPPLVHPTSSGSTPNSPSCPWTNCFLRIDAIR